MQFRRVGSGAFIKRTRVFGTYLQVVKHVNVPKVSSENGPAGNRTPDRGSIKPWFHLTDLHRNVRQNEGDGIQTRKAMNRWVANPQRFLISPHPPNCRTSGPHSAPIYERQYRTPYKKRTTPFIGKQFIGFRCFIARWCSPVARRT